ncbi:MAG: PadR family transcriptional regulator [Ilumatobacteraceae bacterium]
MATPSPAPSPTTSSYAVLGLLAVMPLTAYELTVQARRSMHWVWPRSERSLYAEPKRLVKWGWARAVKRSSGRRSVPEYRITVAGRTALRSWLKTPPAEPATDIEAMLRVIFADAGTTDDLRRALESNRDRLKDAIRSQALDQCRDYLDTGGPFPDRLHLIGLFSDFYVRFEELIDDWTADALVEIDGWPDAAGVGMTAASRRTFEHIVARYGGA